MASSERLSVCLLAVLFATEVIMTVSAQSDTLDRLETLEQKLALYEDKITTLQTLIETRNTIIHRQAKLINNFEELTGIADITDREREPERVDPTDAIDGRTPAFSASGQVYRDAPDEFGNNINVIVNEGPGFDEQRRIFTCGIPGLYLFHAAIRSPGSDSDGNSTAEGQIVMNGKTLVGMRVDPFHEGQSLSVSNSVIKRLEEGDQVWLDVTSDQDIVEVKEAELTTLIDTLREQNITLYEQNSKLEDILQRCDNDNEENEMLQNNLVNCTMALLKVHMSLLRSLTEHRAEETVAFTVYLEQSTETYRYQDPLIFNRIITNEGNGYDSTTGIFTCPKSGLYWFYFSVKQNGLPAMYHGLIAALKVNGNSMTGTSISTFHEDQHMQGSNVLLVRLEFGDEVWVWPSGSLDGDIAATTFSGIKLSS